MCRSINRQWLCSTRMSNARTSTNQQSYQCTRSICIRMSMCRSMDSTTTTNRTTIEPQTPQIEPQPQQIVPQPQQIEPRRPIGTPIRVTCQTETLCQCPPDHIGECKILCEGTQDACKDVSIKCNNGYACI
eukprot:369502_1